MPPSGERNSMTNDRGQLLGTAKLGCFGCVTAENHRYWYYCPACGTKVREQDGSDYWHKWNKEAEEFFGKTDPLWTQEMPRESGHYWVRSDEPISMDEQCFDVVFVDAEEGEAYYIGDERSTKYVGCKHEYWPMKIETPMGAGS